MKKYLAIVILCCLIVSCDWDSRLLLINHSNKNYKRYWEIMEINDTIPDDSNCETWTPYNLYPNEENYLRTQNRWNLALKDKPAKILRIFIYDEDTLIKYGSCGILRKPVYKKRIDLTYQDILKLNWRIDYYDK